tara:strand:+ start:1602 stop:1937 length:336 start_codon:yes stop_codon:yes gene_type:complete
VISLKRQKAILAVSIIVAIGAGIWLLFLYKDTLEEISHRESNKAVLEKDIMDLRSEANKHRKYLDELRKNPEFQDAVARRELGYAKEGERVTRFPADEEFSNEENIQTKIP